MRAEKEFVTSPVKVTKRTHRDIPDHSHDFFELVYVLKGSADHRTEEETGRVKAGDYFFIDYGRRHGYAGGDRDFTIVNCLFLPEFLDGSLFGCKSFREIAECFLVRFDYAGLTSVPVGHIFTDGDGEIGKLFVRMLEIYEKEEIGYSELLRCYLIEIIVFTLRKLSGGHPREKDRRVQKIRNEIEKRYGEDLSLGGICREMHFSLPFISRLFKKAYGMTFRDCLQETRVRNACHLLAHTDLPIEEIAGKVGYADTKYFRSVFRKKIGDTPMKYRKRSRTFRKNAAAPERKP